MEKIKNFFLKNQTMKQALIKNSFWLFASESTARLLKLALIIYAARVLGASGWGVFSYAISVGGLLMIFSDMGINNLLIREMSQKKAGFQNLISTMLLLKVSILSVSALLVIFISPMISNIPEAATLFPIIAVIFFFDVMREIGLTVNRALEKMERDMVVKTITNALILGLGIMLLKIEVSPKSVALAYAIGSAAGFATILFMIRKYMKEFLGAWDVKLVGPIIKTAWPFVFIIFLGAIMGNTDIYMLGVWKDSAEIGLYASVQRMQNFIVLIPSTIAVAIFPLMSRLIVSDKTQSRMVLEKTLALIMLIGLPIALGGMILADQIVPSVFGHGYLGAIPVMQVFMLMMLASFPLLLLSNAILTHNKQKELVPAYMLGILVNVLLNFLLIPQFGAVGSAVATLASTAAITAIILKKLKAISYFEIMPKLKIAFLATFVMALTTLTLKHFGVNFIVNVGTSSVIYFFVLFLLKEPTIRELKEFISNVG